MMRGPVVSVALVLANLTSPPEAQSLDDSRLLVELWNAGATRPVSATFVAAGDLLVFQNHDGRVLRIVDGTPTNEALDLTVAFQSARGIVADPDVANNGYVYLYYGVSKTGDGGAWAGTEVMRYTFDGTNLTAPFGPIFSLAFDVNQANPNTYNAGTLRFGADGKLYGRWGTRRAVA